MKVNSKAGFIAVRGKNLTYNDFITSLLKIPSYEIIELYGRKNILLPRFIRMKILRNILNSEVKRFKLKGINLSDEVNYRLNWYDLFSEFQLQNLLYFFIEKEEEIELNRKYQEEIILMLLNLSDYFDVTNEEIESLVVRGKSLNNKLESPKDFDKSINLLFGDINDEIDGISKSQFRETLINSSTIIELRNLALKYNIKVPTRIKKNELIDLIINYLKEKKSFNEEELRSELNLKSIIQIQRFAKDNDIKASTDLKKDEIIEYIIEHFSKPTKQVLKKVEYNIIQSSDIEENNTVNEVVVEKIIDNTKKSYEVKFIVDGNNYLIQNILENNKVVEPKDPIIDNLIFKGWFKDNTKYDFNEEVKTNFSLIGKFEDPNKDKVKEVIVEKIIDNTKKEYEVKFIVKDKEYARQFVLENRHLIEPKEPKIQNLNFLGWYLLNGERYNFNSKVTDNFSLYAYFENEGKERIIEKVIDNTRKEYEVQFFVQNNLYAQLKVLENSLAIEPREPKLTENYKFIGWVQEDNLQFDFSKPIKSNVKLYAKFEDLNDNKVKEVVVEKIIDNTKKEYSANFYVLNNLYLTQSVLENKFLIEPKQPELNNSKFLGWYLENGQKYDFNTVLTSNINLYAKFEEIKTDIFYTISFYTFNNESFTETVAKNNIPMEPKDPYLENYKFIGWYDNETDEPFLFNKPITKNINLFAKWKDANDNILRKEVRHVVKYYYEGSEIHSNLIKENEKAVPYLDYEWYKDKELKEKFDFNTPIEEDLILYGYNKRLDQILENINENLKDDSVILQQPENNDQEEKEIKSVYKKKKKKKKHGLLNILGALLIILIVLLFLLTIYVGLCYANVIPYADNEVLQKIYNFAKKIFWFLNLE